MKSNSLTSAPSWADELPFPVTLCDCEGVILYMNEASVKSFAKRGGAELIGQNLLDCHPGDSRKKVEALLKTGSSNVYTTEKNGVKKLVYQSPWFSDGKYAGLVEMVMPIPASMPHFIRS